MTDSPSNEMPQAGSASVKVCFTVLRAYPAIDPQCPGAIGGMETRSWLMARALAALPEFQVEFLVRVPQQVRRTEFEGVRIHAAVDRLSDIRSKVSANVNRANRFPWMRFRKFTPSLLWQIPLLACYEPFRPQTHASHDFRRPLSVYTQLSANVLVTFGVNVVSAAVVASAKASGKRTVLCVAHDDDLDERYRPDSNFVNAYNDPAPACHYALDQCDEIVVQTVEQRDLLQQRFGREGTVIENPIDLNEWDARSRSCGQSDEATEDRYVLWIGRAERTQKRPQFMPELARLCPELKFLMVMNPRDRELKAQIERDAPENLRLQGPVPFPEMPGLFQRATVLVNTSASEGFPNTFLQAAASGVPIASLDIGESFLKESNAGSCAEGSMERLSDIVQQYANRSERVPETAVREYLIQHHGLEVSIKKLAELIQKKSP